jgi:hypothetical protein
MIILLDGNVWEKMAEPFLKGSPKSGTLILQGHLPDSQFFHWVKDIGGKKLLGRVELSHLVQTNMAKINPQHVKASGFPSKEFLRRTFLTFSKNISAITVAEIRIVEVERYWCPNCLSVNLEFLKKNIIGDKLPFSCFDCGEEFYLKDLEEGNLRVKLTRLKKRYCQAEIKKIPSDQQTVVALAGEQWLMV